MIKNDPSKPKLMILRKFCCFSENFLKNFPILRWIRHFQRDETRDAEESGGGEWYQIENDSKAKKLYKENRLKRLYDPIHRAQKSNDVMLHYVIIQEILRNNKSSIASK